MTFLSLVEAHHIFLTVTSFVPFSAENKQKHKIKVAIENIWKQEAKRYQTLSDFLILSTRFVLDYCAKKYSESIFPPFDYFSQMIEMGYSAKFPTNDDYAAGASTDDNFEVR